MVNIEVHNFNFNNNLLDKVWNIVRLLPYEDDCYITSKATFRTKGNKPHPVIRVFGTDRDILDDIGKHLHKLADVELVHLHAFLPKA